MSATQDERNQQLTVLNIEIKDVMEKKQLLLKICENLNQEFINIIQ